MSPSKPKKGRKTLSESLKFSVPVHPRCAKCLPAKCCQYFSLEIDPPTCKRDYDDFLWFLAHENVSIYLWEKKWYLMVHNVCKYLDTEENICTNYENRPKMCRDHSVEDCEFNSDYEFDEHFKSDDELKQWMKKKKIIKK